MNTVNIVKNIIDDALEYNEYIAKFNSKGKPIDIEPIKVDKVITISLEEYKELLVYKGKYLGITNETTITSMYADNKIFEELVDNEKKDNNNM